MREQATTTQTTARRYTVDQLAGMSVTELEDIYREGTLFDMSALDGAPPGRMLTIVGALGWQGMRRRVAAFARSSVFPWGGKSFHSFSTTTGRGINRVALLGEKFPFDTRIEASAIDGKDCIFLDYDKPTNPWFIRAIRDELREVSPGLFLGPAMWAPRGATPKLVLWFAIDHT